MIHQSPSSRAARYRRSRSDRFIDTHIARFTARSQSTKRSALPPEQEFVIGEYVPSGRIFGASNSYQQTRARSSRKLDTVNQLFESAD